MELRNTHKSSFTGKPSLRFSEWEVDSLVDYIADKHHSYLRKSIPEVSALLEEVVKVNGKLHPEILSISRLFNELTNELISHMMREESIVFPFIKKYYLAKNPNEIFQKEEIDNIHTIIAKMEQEHDVFGRKLDTIRILSGNYILPQDVSESYSHLFQLLKEFENDFFIHLHLEDHILFPKVFGQEPK